MGELKIKLKKSYDCSRCSGFCCSYPLIEVTAKDIALLAKYFKISPQKARDKYTKDAKEPKLTKHRVLRHQYHPVYNTICAFYNPHSWRCTIYDARPDVCHEYPGKGNCAYFNFLDFERRHQRDESVVIPVPNNMANNLLPTKR